jgi:hypothetical protein
MTFAPLINRPSAVKRPFLNVLQQCGAMNGLQCLLDAGDGRSSFGDQPSGTASFWAWHDVRYTLTPPPSVVAHWARGASLNTAESIDPAFAGTANSLDASNYYSFDGTQYFSLNGGNAGNPWIQNLHRANAKFGFLYWVYLGTPVAPNIPQFFCDAGGSSTIGCQFDIDTTDRTLRLVVTTGSGYANITVSSIVVPVGKWSCVGVSVNATTGAGFFFVSGQQSTFSAAYASPSAGNATYNALISAWADAGSVNHRLWPGSRLGAAFMWESVAPTFNQFNAIYQATRGRFRV